MIRGHSRGSLVRGHWSEVKCQRSLVGGQWSGFTGQSRVSGQRSVVKGHDQVSKGSDPRVAIPNPEGHRLRFFI